VDLFFELGKLIVKTFKFLRELMVFTNKMGILIESNLDVALKLVVDKKQLIHHNIAVSILTASNLILDHFWRNRFILADCHQHIFKLLHFVVKFPLELLIFRVNIAYFVCCMFTK